MSTLAFHLAADEVKPAIRTLFTYVAEYLQQQERSPERQAVYSKTLLGVRSAKAVEEWVTDNRDILLALDSNEDWLTVVWGQFSEQSDDKFFHGVEPESLAIQLATRWIRGSPYSDLFALSLAEEGSKSWGEKCRNLTEDDIVDFCENTLGFECSLVVAAVVQFLFGESGLNDENSAALTLFQKAFKYGLTDWPSISCYEYGFSDRVLAQRLCDAVRSDGFSDNGFAQAIDSHRERIEESLKDFPGYFESVLAGRVRLQ
jgi:hypothetical protein